MHISTPPLRDPVAAAEPRSALRAPLAYDLGYGLVGLIIVAAIAVRYDDLPLALTIGALMALCYLAGGVRYRSH